MKTTELAFVSLLALIIVFPASAQQAPATQPAPNGARTQPARQFRLILLDDSGKAVEGAEVAVTASNKPNSSTTARTDSQGRCTVAIPAIQADRWVFKITKAGYIPLRTSMSAAGAEKLFAEETTLRMTKGQTIGGVVKDEAGRPIKDVVLGFYWYNQKKPRQAVTDDMDLIPVRTDADGKWVCDFAPPEFDDSFSIFLCHPQYVSDHWGYNISSPKYPRPSLDALRSQQAVYVMKRGFVLTGKITDSDGKPVRGAQVRMIERAIQRPANSERTNADGSFTFKNAENSSGSFIVTARGFSPEKLAYDLSKETPLVITLAPAGVIRGKVIDSKGMPIPGALVFLSKWPDRNSYYSSMLQWSTQTDKNGSFTWSDAPRKGGTFGVSKQGYMQQDDLTLLPSDKEQLITLSDPLRITGRVLDAATGKPVNGARVIQGIDWGGGGRPYFDRQNLTPVKDGKYEVEITGSYPAFVLRAEADGYTPAVSESIPRDAGRRTLDFRLEKGKPIAGKVLGLDGKPLAGVTIHLVTFDDPALLRNGKDFQDRIGVATTSGADGAFSFAQPEGYYAVFAFTDAGYGEVNKPEFENTRELRLAAWGRIEGVVKQGSKPAAGANVVVSDTSRVIVPVVRKVFSGISDAQGRFVIGSVPPGQYDVHRTTGPYNTGNYLNTEPVTVEAGKAATVTLGGHGRTVIGKLSRPVGPGENDSRDATIRSAASIALERQIEAILPANYEKMDAAQREDWYRKWAQTEQGKAFVKLSIEIRSKDQCRIVLVNRDGGVQAHDIPPGQYVLSASLGKFVNASYVATSSVERAFEVPPITGNDLDTPLDLGVLEVQSTVVAPKAGLDAGVAVAGHTASEPNAPDVLNKPLKLDLAAGLAGKKLLVVAASIEQRPSRRILDILAASQDAVAKQGFAIVLVHPAVTDEKQVKKWLADHKLDVAQMILAKDQADAAKLMAACGAESLPFMLLTDDKHAVAAVGVQPDQLSGLGDIPAGTQQSTTSPAPSAEGDSK